MVAFAKAAPPVTAVAFSPEGDALVFATQANVTIRQVASGQQAKLPTKLPHVHDLAFSPDGERLAVVGGAPSEWGEVEIYRWPSGEFVSRYRTEGDVVSAAAWSGDGQRLALATGKFAEVVSPWRGETPTEPLQFVGHSKPVTAVAFLPDSKVLITAAADQSIRVWNVETVKLIRSLGNHTKKVNAVAVRPGERKLPQIASVGADRTVRFWQPTIGRMMRFVRLESQPLAVAFPPSGDHALVCGVDGSLTRIDPETAQIIDENGTITGWAYSIAAGAKGPKVAIGGEDGQLKILTLD